MTAFMFYDVVLAVHILAVVIAFGIVFAYPILDAVLKSSGIELAALHRMHVELATKVIQPAMTIVLLSGLYLAIDRDLFGKPWVSVPFAIIVVLFALMGAVLVPTDKRLAELAAQDAGGAPSAAYEAEAKRAQLFGSIALLLVVVAVFVMTVKPG